MINVQEVKSRSDWEHINRPMARFQNELLYMYEYVLYVDIDEIVFHPMGLDNYIDGLDVDSVSCNGFEVVQRLGEEPPIDWDKPIFGQRNYWYPSKLYSKPLLSRVPLDWTLGFHSVNGPMPPVDPELKLLHLHKVDFDAALAHNRSNQVPGTPLIDHIDRSVSASQNMLSEAGLKEWWNTSVDDGRPVETELIPQYIIDMINI